MKPNISDTHQSKVGFSKGNEDLKTKKVSKSSMGSLNLKKISSANSKTTEVAHEEPVKTEPRQPKNRSFFDEIDDFFTNLDKPAPTTKTTKTVNNTPKSNSVNSNGKTTKPKHEFKTFDIIAIVLGASVLFSIIIGIFVFLLGL
ncbi:MAG: hypothetical protein R3Y51_01035 [Rikenellaceae bacterium]